ncbi:hypothetical protein [Agrobacterium tumefaciens]|uniref:hypothetical protein n=1 Tax=Agrobacterium tumefaciens TaxID=358 RepID=UPI0006187AE9|nr:hypothetical protein [Agrobacterium tumefaciens]AKC07226.1 hypothetical protein Ach5_14500 [Agrobacterium tumefaciens]AYM67367.1 hypothetical protein AtA6_11500 [Agrobacterium tumefaciens]NIB54956.1 hypothetical protein [Agrobacterium tumefaciens]NSZ21673.1 hypothetical protein [Agrobacterium tumefaciens]QQE32565.1 hypothetical protein I6I05_11480 [Agrobacterium tumefaciens]
MNSWTKRLLGELTKCGLVERDEDENTYQATVSTISESLWQELKSIRSRETELSVKVRLVSGPEDEQDLLEFDARPSHESLIVSIAKNHIQDKLRFFERENLVRTLATKPEIFERATLILVADIDSGPTALGSRTLPWLDEVSIDVASIKEVKSPRVVVNDASGRGLVPENISCWLTTEADHELMSDFYGPVAARRLSLSLPSALLEGTGKSLFAITELKRKTKVSVEPQSDAVWANTSLLKELNDLAVWVYYDGPDTDNRHSIVASEIARSLPKDETWGKGLNLIASNALETSKIAYRLHLYDKSVEALKLMSDLRKGLAEDVKAVSAQTASLSAGLWRDAAVALGGLALKSLTNGSGLVVVVTIVYLVISCFLNSEAASQAVSAVRKNEQMFKQKLYLPIVSKDEYREISGARYDEIISDFNRYKRQIKSVYGGAITALSLTLVHEYASEISCFSAHFTRWVGRLSMPDAIALFPAACLN